MTGQNDGPRDIRRGEQRVEIVDTVLNGPHPTGGGIALAKSSPVVAADTCESGNFGLHADPGVSGVPGARVEHDGRGARTRTRDEEGADADVDAVPRGPGGRPRFCRSSFLSDDAHGESQSEGGGKQEDNAAPRAAM